MRRSWRGVSAAVGAVLVVVVVASAALAAAQIRGGSYKGSLVSANDGVMVSFKVSATGKQVTALEISNTPIYCNGGGRPIPVHFKNAAISGKGTFSSTGQYVIVEGPKKGQVGTKLRITGKFLKGRAEQGVLTTTYVGIPGCGGKSPYTTKS
jgi:hypothetical protein